MMKTRENERLWKENNQVQQQLNSGKFYKFYGNTIRGKSLREIYDRILKFVCVCARVKRERTDKARDLGSCEANRMFRRQTDILNGIQEQY